MSNNLRLRERIFREVEQERLCQDAAHGGPAHDDKLSPHQWSCILARTLGLGCDEAGGFTPERWRKQLVRLAATAVAALESHDRILGREVVAQDFQSESGY